MILLIGYLTMINAFACNKINYEYLLSADSIKYWDKVTPNFKIEGLAFRASDHQPFWYDENRYYSYSSAQEIAFQKVWMIKNNNLEIQLWHDSTPVGDKEVFQIIKLTEDSLILSKNGYRALYMKSKDQKTELTLKPEQRRGYIFAQIASQKQIEQLIKAEKIRQTDGLELIPSENYVSSDVLKALGSVFTNKYSEGYPGRRYYGGQENTDQIEQIAINRAKQLFGADHANVQPHSGSQANMGVYVGLLNAGDKILGMSLSAGGHLTHGYKINFSGKNYIGLEYGLHPETELIDYEAVREIALREKPKMIVAGASAYSRIIDFKKFREIADEVGAYLMVDMAHIAGLVAAGLHSNPLEYADVVTSTTHKTLRGPRGGVILTNNEEIAKKIDKTIFPGIQGGPLVHIIAAKAVAFKEALSPEYKEYQEQVVKNAKVLSEELTKGGLRIVSGGTDNHLMLVDLRPMGVTGKLAEAKLEEAGITCNKNAIPNDPEKPFITSGIRLGTPAITTRGFKEEETRQVAQFILTVLGNIDDSEKIAQVKEQVFKLTEKFPLYKGK